ncbi:MAG: tetratricopeptide repeat protein [Limisphaerales bacterium]
MRPVKFLSGTLLLILLLLKVSAQEQQKVEPTRGDGLAAKLKEAEPRLQKEFAELKVQAEAGKAAAQYRLSWLLEYGTGTSVDLKAAFQAAQQSAAAGYGLGQAHLGEMYRFGAGTEPDEEKSNAAFTQAAKSLPALVAEGNTEAMRALSMLHYRGWGGLKQDHAKALALNQQAAEAGDAIGSVEEADQLWDGKGTHRQRSKATRLYRAALPKLMTQAEQGDRRAQLIVGNLLATERPTGKRDFEESIKWHQPGADAGYAALQFLIGARYQKGNGKAQNDPEAMKWYELSAAQGNPGAINNVGWMHGNGRAGAGEANDEKASEMYLKAAERGNSVSQNNIAMRLFSGDGVEEDKEKAFYWHKRSAENDNGRGQYFLALRYDTGQGTEPDLEKAVHWYQRAAENDHRAEYDSSQGDYTYGAQMKLSDIYREGRGAKRDLARALYWMARTTEFERSEAVNAFLKHETAIGRKAAELHGPLQKYLDEGWPVSPRNSRDIQEAAEQGDAQAQYELAALHVLGLGGVGRQPTKVLEWAGKAAAQGHAGALFYLGICHEEGRGVPSDPAKAREFFVKAATQGHAGAENHLGVLAEKSEAKREVVAAHFAKAAEAGDHRGAYNWARVKEPEKASTPQVFRRYQAAAEQGLAAAQNNLAWLLQQKLEATAEDLEQAARWYRAAANQGHADAQYNLGLMTLRGQGGLKVDRSEAFVWWGRAVMQNHPQAVRQINRLAGLLTAEEIRIARQTIQAWGEGQRVPQLYVVREGD